VTRTAAGYNAWGGNAWSARVGHSYNSRTGLLAAGQHAAVDSAYPGEPVGTPRAVKSKPKANATAARAGAGQATDVDRAASDPKAATTGDSVYSDASGVVYRHTGGGWQQYDSNGGWKSVSAEGARALEAQRQARSWGARRSTAAAWGGGEAGYGGGFRGSAAGFEGGGFRGDAKR